MKSLLTKRCPGRDGSPAKFYRVFKEQTMPALREVFRETEEEKRSPAPHESGVARTPRSDSGITRDKAWPDSPQEHRRRNSERSTKQCVSDNAGNEGDTILSQEGFPGGPDGEESTCPAGDAGDPGAIPGSGRSPGEGNGNPLQYSCLGNPTDRGAWGLQSVGSDRTELTHHTALPGTQGWFTAIKSNSTH